jgi:ABC-type nickel/cobalt efflux system permease component RcnA
VGVVGVLGVLLVPAPAQAHPLGNFTTNQYDGVRISAAGVDVDYVLDLAELPAYQAKTGEIDADGNGDLTEAERSAWAGRTCTAVAAATSVTVDGRGVDLTGRAGPVSFPPGAGGLTTLRLECVLHAPAEIRREATVALVNGMFPDRIGWREVTAVGDRYTLVHSDVPTTSISRLLSKYPVGMAGNDVRTASLTVRPGGPAAAPAPFVSEGGNQARDVDRFTTWFTDLVGRPQLTLGVGLLAVLIALVLGGAHAVAPGHGKTIMAAYLVGARGRLAQALVVAGTVAATHTAGVLVLGVVLATSLQLAPDMMYSWLRLASGVLVALVGAQLLRTALRRMRGQGTEFGHAHAAGEADTHSHADGHVHDHGAAHDHGHSGHDHDHHPHDHGHDHDHDHGQGGHDHSDGDHGHTHDDGVEHEHVLAPVGQHTHSHDDGDHGHGDHGHGDHTHDDHGHSHDGGHDHARELVAVGQATIPPPDRPAAAAVGRVEEHTHTHGGRPHTHIIPSPDEPLRVRTLLAMGFAGGLSPSPSAVVVLLGAAALGRAWYGVVLVLAYGVGLAATLIGIGFALARWGERLRRTRSGRWSHLLTYRMPTATATVILLVGIGMVAFAAAGLLGI